MFEPVGMRLAFLGILASVTPVPLPANILGQLLVFNTGLSGEEIRTSSFIRRFFINFDG